MADTQDTVTLALSGEEILLRRLVPAVLLVLGLSVLGLAAWLRPDPHGLGTHEELGLPACAFYLTTGYPCATCGMTTSFAWAAHGHLLMAFYTQPAGALLALLTAACVLVCAWALVTGADLAPLARRVLRPGTFLAAGVIILGAWGYKVLTVRGIFP